MIPGMQRCLRLVATLSLAGACAAEPPITDCSPAQGIEPICGLQAPEDFVVTPLGRWLMVSQYAGFDPNANYGSLVALGLPHQIWRLKLNI